MAELASVEAYLEGKDEGAIALFRGFEELVERCGPSEAAPRSSIVYWKRKRLELNVDLLREAEHPCKLAAFPHTKRVITHRLRVTEPTQLDDALAAQHSSRRPTRT